MRTERLLIVASLLCGSHARQTVFEPLVADWQREWHAAHGFLSSLRVIVRGAAAYATSLLVAIDTREAVQRHATTIGWAALPAFTLLGGMLYLLPGSWALLNEAALLNRSPIAHLAEIAFWFAPSLLGFGLVLALLPTCLTLAWNHARIRHLLAACVLAAMASVAIDGWAVPYMSEQRLRHRFGEHAVANRRLVRMTVGDHVRQTMHPDPQIAADARATLLRMSMKLVLMTALGVIGGVVGRSRFIAHTPIGVRTIAGYWLFGWAAAGSLQFFTTYLGYYLALRPYRVTLWLPPVMLLLVGVAGWIVLRRTQGSRALAHVG